MTQEAIKNLIELYKYAYGLIDKLEINGKYYLDNEVTVEYPETILKYPRICYDNTYKYKTYGMPITKKILINMEEYDWNTGKTNIYTKISDKEKLIKRLTEEKVEQEVEIELDDELSKNKYKNKQLSKKELFNIKSKIREEILNNISIEDELEIYESVWPEDKYRPIWKP